ncbi:MAG: hypothetical protein GXP25_02520 [Planctomycetes bacterium]|nr:hypothetical protein [Planctomycetota bacterium]
MMRRALVFSLLLLVGCASVSNFPRHPASVEQTPDGSAKAYTLGKASRPNYWRVANAEGRVVVLRFDRSGDGKPDLTVDLDKLDLKTCRHLVILLDGMPFGLVEEAYKSGKFRLFHPPSRLYSCFPSMTWLAFPLIFHTEAPLGVEADYLDRKTGRRSDDMTVYMQRTNEPWRPCVDYRCGSLVDALCYVSPLVGFTHEMDVIRKRFETRGKRVFVGYNASSAGMGTAKGREGFEAVLDKVDRFCEEMMAESKGAITITMFADHGHSLTPARRIPLTKFLRKSGYHPADRLKKRNDVVVPTFGLCTDAVVYANDPAGVARALTDLEGVDLVVYPTGDSITVRKHNQKARVFHKGGRYRYHAVQGDPLELLPIIATLKKQGKVDDNGFIDDRALFEATALHKYPDPLYRIWLCWHGAVQNPPDVVASLKNSWYWGSRGFGLVANVASTHGNLSYSNTVTFAMTTAGPLPPRMRLVDLKPALAKYFPLP